MWINLPSDYELQQIVDRPFNARAVVNDQQVVNMAKEILEYHELINKLKEVLGINVIEAALKIGAQYNDC